MEVRDWLARLKPDVAIVVYNDHGAEFMFDKYPTFALGAVERYAIADEGFGTRPLPPVRGDAGLSTHLAEALIADEFDLTVCQEMGVEHGFLVPMNLCFPHDQRGWPVAAVPLQVNVVQHPLPSGRRCYKLGQALARAIASYPGDLNVVVMGTGGMSHQLQGRRFGYMTRRSTRGSSIGWKAIPKPSPRFRIRSSWNRPAPRRSSSSCGTSCAARSRRARGACTGTITRR